MEIFEKRISLVGKSWSLERKSQKKKEEKKVLLYHA